MTVFGDLIDYLASGDLSLGEDWAASEDLDSYGLDWRAPDGTKFWLTLNRDGTIDVYWRPDGRPVACGDCLKFIQKDRTITEKE